MPTAAIAGNILINPQLLYFLRKCKPCLLKNAMLMASIYEVEAQLAKRDYDPQKEEFSLRSERVAEATCHTGTRVSMSGKAPGELPARL
ncbi:hypothetical protein PF010_g3900 [Phytophthora fragariae]|uniref:Uncharacterized protein n=1 Tax=Phytophthora fragariae TaxID=53985 RepID=A0A6A3M782_9STRA|nr:hypothetical protein PF011_g3653 [Phytophthora fragariae]KAE9130297.1 hypothetical protein PF010_g3900 [Phytophthora fragariae]KAE9248444.1 hypothetical protein PF004_g3862 [Phytophthora fragariae]